MQIETGVEECGEHMGRKPASHADLEALPPNVVGELISGELHVSPRPAVPHAVASSRMGARLISSFDLGEPDFGGWLILFEPELRLEEDVLVPDLAGWRRERMPVPPRAAAFHVAPDWACEVLSPSTVKLDREDKLPVYAREGVSHVWLVDPEERTVEVLRLEGSRYVLVGTYAGSDILCAEPFDALELDLDRLWAESGPGQSSASAH
jgi:Uma2 family endonuclease